MSVEQTIKKALSENPEIRLILDIATRARDVQAQEPPREIGSSAEVIAVPLNTQHAI